MCIRCQSKILIHESIFVVASLYNFSIYQQEPQSTRELSSDISVAKVLKERDAASVLLDKSFRPVSWPWLSSNAIPSPDPHVDGHVIEQSRNCSYYRNHPRKMRTFLTKFQHKNGCALLMFDCVTMERKPALSTEKLGCAFYVGDYGILGHAPALDAANPTVPMFVGISISDNQAWTRTMTMTMQHLPLPSQRTEQKTAGQDLCLGKKVGGHI